MFDAIERFACTLLSLGYDLDRLVLIEGEPRYVAGVLRGRVSTHSIERYLGNTP